MTLIPRLLLPLQKGQIATCCSRQLACPCLQQHSSCVSVYIGPRHTTLIVSRPDLVCSADALCIHDTHMQASILTHNGLLLRSVPAQDMHGDAAVLIRHGCYREAAASSNSKGRKKTPEELSVEVLLHFAGTVRAFYASVAKAVHAQGRRRDDPAVQPNASMLAGSVTLGIILKRNLGPAAEVGLTSKMHQMNSSKPRVQLNSQAFLHAW